jgi:hypothetical protein
LVDLLAAFPRCLRVAVTLRDLGAFVWQKPATNCAADFTRRTIRFSSTFG